MDTEPTKATPPRTATEFVSAPRLIDLLPNYLGWLRGRGHRPIGIATYAKDVRTMIAALGGDDATPTDLTWQALSAHQSALAERGLAPATIGQQRRAVDLLPSSW